ncbi:hypothetical protein FDP41_010009 [Naegleria fowleri]|uniref:DNA-directed RNA polymerase subunit n=1 Tax=Naegleria fowleri TaxID=5763 RepID=A0A6A5BAJ5_NAEFO|nr:uncharacterized protein FDP41_010009 [Naegleria fowleri]KAF0971786.1 hypothetical protein FDP41_010009 [Naegleria fowleri]CAG4709124.1 unnamed protein product [Naegleria fowleri]
MFFCPYCGNTLLIEKASGRSTSTDSVYRWVCKTCPYVCNIKSEMHFDMKLEKKEVDDVIGDDANWSETVETKCGKCDHNKAYFQMFQTRSADEPMTQFFKCCKCGYQWKEG